MAGLDCRHCGQPCFVLRTMPADALNYARRELLLATCATGMSYDRSSTGYDHVTALNPTGPATTEAPAAPAAPAGDGPRPCEACGLPVTAQYIARTGRALHGPCATRASQTDQMEPHHA